ncbi:hypothetical protein GCT19_38325 [Paraburkholderia sp. CNPSo 3155]|nr:hypothetical protein [Paraburkholderia atlantica]NUY35784.1 hypothetical protein [Paraburkholderia atlantica]
MVGIDFDAYRDWCRRNGGALGQMPPGLGWEIEMSHCIPLVRPDHGANKRSTLSKVSSVIVGSGTLAIKCAQLAKEKGHVIRGLCQVDSGAG